MSGKPILHVDKSSRASVADVDKYVYAGLPMLFLLPAGQEEGFLNTVQRLEDIIDLETKTLQSFEPVSLKEFNHKKIYGLIELLRVISKHDSAKLSPEMEIVLSRLRGKLEENMSVLHMHLTAIREISAVMTNAIKEHDSDGTYSRNMSGFGALK
jgi:hypothetical protein